MRVLVRTGLLVGLLLSNGCTTSLAGEPHAPWVGGAASDRRARDAASPAITALREGRFDEAGRLAQGDPNPYARLTGAVVRYKKAGHQLVLDARTLVAGVAAGGVNQNYLATTFESAERELALVDADLAAAARDPELAVELCVACWEIDWNGDGHIDGRDRQLFEIEQDADGKRVPEDDPRRRPTFRFDVGDVAWARAFVGFQRAALDVVLAYDWSEVGALIGDRRGSGTKIVLRLIHKERVEAARARVLEALAQSDAARRAYLAETDDDREWVPSPRQKSHPMPLPVDQKLYDTWEGVLGDLTRIVRGDEGLAVRDIADLASHHRAPKVGGFIDIGGMLAHPRDVTLDLDELRRLEREHDEDGALRSVFGDHYVASMKPSPLPGRLRRMMSEVDRHEETFERKLRYLFWLN